MYLLDEWAKGANRIDRASTVSTEYEVLTRVHLTGELNLGCAYVQFWEIPPSDDPRAVRAAYLRTDWTPGPRPPDLPPRREQYYFPGGPANEIVVLMTLFTRAHFVLARSFQIDGHRLMRRFASEYDVAASDFDGQSISLDSLKMQFEMLQGLRLREEGGRASRRVEPFMLAARLYHAALPFIFSDETVAFLLLVSAIEALLHDVKVDRGHLEDHNPPAARLLHNAVPDATIYAEIERTLLQPMPMLARRFVGFIASHVSDAFWNDPTRPQAPMLRFRDLAQVEEHAARVYEARSKALHRGAPFPPALPDFDSEIPIGLALQIGRKQWKQKELLPSPRAFERLVHHVLMHYFRTEAQLGFDWTGRGDEAVAQ